MLEAEDTIENPGKGRGMGLIQFNEIVAVDKIDINALAIQIAYLININVIRNY